MTESAVSGVLVMKKSCSSDFCGLDVEVSESLVKIE